MSPSRWLSACLILGICTQTITPIRAQDKDPLVDKVRNSIDLAVRYLKGKLEDRGGGQFSWENDSSVLGFAQPGGQSCLAMLALLTAGVKPEDPAIKKALSYIRDLTPKHVYVTGLQTLVLAELGENRDLELIQRNVDWLVKSRVTRQGKLLGWSYENAGVTTDNSNTQYALLGLWAGRQAGAKIDKAVWQSIQDFYIDTQINENNRTVGGWSYQPERAGTPSYTMTAAGVCGLYISGLEVGIGKQELDPKTGIAKKCGFYEDNDALAKGLRFLGARFNLRQAAHSYYNIYGIERVGRLSGQRFIGEHDWYREGCEILTGVRKDINDLIQRPDGSWVAGQGIDKFPVVSTSFALLFLAKGRTPILISKLAYDTDNKPIPQWNRKHHDGRNLVEFVSRELFKRHPLAWQIYDPRRVDLSNKKTFDEELASLSVSPILYFNGHERPALSDRQKELLRRYVEEGGFIMAEACCGSEEFTKGFSELMKEVFQEKTTPLKPLPPDHPIWSAHSLVKPTTFPNLMGVERGCRTVVVFSPQPLAGFWEEARFAPEVGRPAVDLGQNAYRLAGNIIAYATNLELPQPRLTRVKITDKSEEKNLPRHVLKLAQIKTYGQERLASAAMRNLAQSLRDTYRLDVALEMDAVSIEKKDDISNYKMLYVHGSKKFNYDNQDLENVRFNLLTGGLLLADPCCGKKEFHDSFIEFIDKLFPKDQFPNLKLERIPADDYLFSEKLNGKAIAKVKCRTEKAEGNPTGMEEIEPFFQGIKYEGRWIVIYTPYDLGCALEKNKSIACKGYSHEDAVRLAGAAVLYALKR